MGDDAPEVSVIDLRSAGRVAKLNFLAGEGSAHVRASPMLNAFKASSEALGVRVTYHLLSGTVALAEQGFGITELQPLFSADGGFRAHLLSRLKDESAKAVLSDFDRLAPQLQLQLWQELANKVHPFLFQPEMRAMLGQGEPPDMAAMLDSPRKVTLVSLGVTRMPAAVLVGRLLLAAIERRVMARADVPEAARAPVRLFIDEASRVAGFGLESLLAEGRRMGCAVTLAMQFTGQSEKTLQEAIRANCSTLVIFGGGASEAAELAPEVVSDLPRDKVRDAIMALSVGEAIIAVRGAPSVKVRLTDSPVPAASEAALARLRAKAEAATTVSAEDAEAAMKARADWIVGLGRTTDAPEIDHRRRPRRWEGEHE